MLLLVSDYLARVPNFFKKFDKKISASNDQPEYLLKVLRIFKYFVLI